MKTTEEKHPLNEYLEYICPNEGELQQEGHALYAELIDEELDPFRVDFNYDVCATIDTENLSYLVLSIENLRDMISLIEESEDIYKNTDILKDEEYEQ